MIIKEDIKAQGKYYTVIVDNQTVYEGYNYSRVAKITRFTYRNTVSLPVSLPKINQWNFRNDYYELPYKDWVIIDIHWNKDRALHYTVSPADDRRRKRKLTYNQLTSLIDNKAT